MIVLVGASATGKSAIVDELVSKHQMKKFVTCTTRQKRWNETDDIDYHFLSKEEFIKKIENDEFIEYVIYNGNYYGSLKSECQDDKVIILEPSGLKSFLQKNIKLFAVYINIDEAVRYERMLIRGDSKEMALSRLETDKVVFNDELKQEANLIINKANLSIEEIASKIYKEYTKWI